MFKHLPRDPPSVNAMKQTCLIVILAYFTLSSTICTENAAKTLNCRFSYTGFNVLGHIFIRIGTQRILLKTTSNINTQKSCMT